MDDLRNNLMNSHLGRALASRGFTMPANVSPVPFAAAITAALGHHGSVGAARINGLGELEPAATGEGLGWGHDAWDALDQAPIDADVPGIVCRLTDGGTTWRWALCFATGRVAQVPVRYAAGVNR